MSPPGDLRSLHPEWNGRSDYAMIGCLLPGHRDGTPSYAVYPDHGYCFGCKRWVGYHEHVRLVGSEPTAAAPVGGKDRPTYRPDELSRWAGMYHAHLTDAARAYYHWRGLEDTTIDRYQLGYFADAYSLPIWDGPEITGIKFRRDDGVHRDGPKYWGLKGMRPTLFAPRGVGAEMVWCEGEFDALLLAQLGYGAVSLTGGIGADPAPIFDRLDPVRRCVVALDWDGVSYRPSHQIGQALVDRIPDIKIGYARWGPDKDATEAYQRGGEELVRSKLCPSSAC